MPTTPSAFSVDALDEAIKNCERELIHQLGYIQPGGILLAVDDAGLLISHVSKNISEWFPFSAAELPGKPLALLIGGQQAESIRQLLGLQDWRCTAVTAFTIVRHGVALNLDAQISRSGNVWIIEIEQEEKGKDDLFHKLFIPIRDALWQLDAEVDVSRYTQKVVEQVRLLTGYDRVMMYQFDEKWDGEVVAESKTADAESYLGNHFPAGDIPPQARSLYTKNLIRLVADVDAVPVPIYPTLHQDTHLPLDLTFSALRALSPIHIEYLKNMGVRATLTISLLQNDRLWGLIACHHFSPKYVPLRIRELDEFIGKTVSLKLSNLESKLKTDHQEHIRVLLRKLTQQIRVNRNIAAVIEMFRGDLLSLVKADGAIININGHRYHLGETPSDEQENQIDGWLKTLAPNKVFQTDCLPALNPLLKAYSEVACGLMVAPLDHHMQNYIAWFRSSITKTIRWAGDPKKMVKHEHGKLIVSPRESFSSWVETFRNKAAPWAQIEVDAAHSLALTLIEVLNHQALEQSEESYRFLAENSSDMIARFDDNGIYTFVSPACENLFGYKPQQIVGRPVIEFIADEDLEDFVQALESLGAVLETETVLFRPKHASGKTVWLEYTLKRTFDSKSGKREIVANGRDVTQRHIYQLAIEDLHRRNAMILEAAGDGMISFDANGKIIYSNEKANQLLGCVLGELTGRSCCDLLYTEADASSVSCRGSLLRAIQRQQSDSSSDCYFQHKDGHAIRVKYTLNPMADNAQFIGSVLVFDERGERELVSNNMQTTDAILNETSEAVMVTDTLRCIVSVNPAFTAITGYSAEEAIGQTPRLLRSGVHTPHFYEAMFAAIAEKNYWAGEIWNRRKNGEIYPQWGSITPIYDEYGVLRSYVSVFSDVSKAKQAEEHLIHLANHDSLTGLANRAKFVDFLNQIIERARRKGKENIAVAFIDLDRFKIINDTLGHAVGDLYLQAIAKRIAGVCRNEDLLSRWGGDEFVLAMDHISGQASVADVVRRIMETVRQPMQIEGHELEPTLSVGISLYPQDADNTTDLVKAADTAMYRVKSSGRNGFAFFTEHQADENKKKFEIVSELNRALRLNEFLLHYQPQVNPESGQIVGLEALVRWQHPERGYLAPFHFIALAEELGLINSVGEWVIQAACRQMAAWKMQGVEFSRVAVNISPSQLNPELVGFVQGALTSNGLSAALLELELTESALEKGEQILPVLQQLRQMGVSLSIDDFGTGYSSLGHLKNFPINCFKIDKSFVDGLPESTQDAAIVKTILSLGENLNMEVVVEGVETIKQRDYLVSIGAKIIQGYYYAKPVSAEEMTKLLRVGYL